MTLREKIEGLLAELRAIDLMEVEPDIIPEIASRLIAALAEDAGGWRGMGSAPRDFTPILASAIGADGRQFCAIVHWTQISSIFRSDIRMDLTAPDCEWVGVLGTRYGVPFTHWRPLPEPPPQEPQP